jgi:ATP-dependent DNA ligase
LLDGADRCLQFSEAIEDDGPAVFARADAMGLEGIVSKRKGSTYRSGGSAAWQKTKTYTTGMFAVIGASQTPTGIPTALLATMGEEGPVYAGSAFVNMGAAARDIFWRYVEDHAIAQPALRMPKMSATWVQPGLAVEVRHLRGEGMLRHASVTGVHDDGR